VVHDFHNQCWVDPDPNPDPLVRGMDPDPSIIQQKLEEKPWFPLLRLLFDFLLLKNDVKEPSKNNMQKNFFFKFVFCWHLDGQWWK
jgi:hypothetical protein